MQTEQEQQATQVQQANNTPTQQRDVAEEVYEQAGTQAEQYVDGILPVQTSPTQKRHGTQLLFVATALIVVAVGMIGAVLVIRGGDDPAKKQPTSQVPVNSESAIAKDASPPTKEELAQMQQSDLLAVQSQLAAYYAINKKYPLLAELNSSSWRAKNLQNIPDDALTNPEGDGSVELVAEPKVGRYAYQPMAEDGSTCDNVTKACVRYHLRALTDDGEKSISA